MTDAEVLITGPSGVGKELYANYVHQKSRRKHGKFVPINCGSLSTELLENELFGHIGGAFTGANMQHQGLVSEAEGGSLFLDEVDSLSIPCQIKLLRFLQDKQYRRLGETRLRQANIRIIAATNTNLEVAVYNKRFREDLFFRLRVVPINIPALCSRQEDIIALLARFAQQYAERFGLPPVEYSTAALERMKNYSWPGNVRELENCVEYLTCLQLGRQVEPEDLPLLKKLAELHTESENDERVVVGEVEVGISQFGVFQESKERLIADFEKQYIRCILENTKGNVSAAARLSGKNRRALFELMRKHQIDPGDYRIAPPDTSQG